MKTIFGILISVAGAMLVSCVNEGIEIKDDGYFPLREGNQWEYQRKLFSTNDPATLEWTDVTENIIKGDTTIDNLTYKIVVDQNGQIVKVLRKEEGKYYGRHHELYGSFSSEYLFLDDNSDPGTVWKHYKNDGANLTQYNVKAVNSSRTFNNIEYTDVMEIQVDYYYRDVNEYVLLYSTLHFYAKGIGEIYAYYPYPSLMYGDLDISLLEHNP